MKFRLPEGFGDREEALRSLLRQEAAAAASDLAAVRVAVMRFLTDKKGYLPEDIESDREFDVSVGDTRAVSTVDMVIAILGKRMISVKCSADSLVSRQRQALACARLADACPVPIAVITDGEGAILLDTVSGKVMSEGLDSIPSREELYALHEGTGPKELSPDRAEREKRIVQAFDSIGRSGQQS